MFDFANILSDLFAPLETIRTESAFARLFLAGALATPIGWERESDFRAAGLRTHTLISMAACMFTLVAMELTHFPANGRNTLSIDPLRLINAVTAGVAFLGAGSIITGRGGVRGLATGASMWMAGAIGLACGTGDGILAAMGTGLALVILWLARLAGKTDANKRIDPGQGIDGGDQ